MKKTVTSTYNRLANAFKKPIVVEGQGAPINDVAQGSTMGDWEVPTVEMDAGAFLRASNELYEGIERRKAQPETVGMADDDSYGGDWNDVKTTEYVQINGEWVRK